MFPESRIEFEIAIICALPVAADPVLRLFDQHYDRYGDRYGKQEGDVNTYSTGRIGRHHVVLAHMPGVGIASAARVATCLGISFPKIRLALLVGICAGVPLERPIILGDVIISDSIVQFDFGRQYPDRFERKSGLEDTLARPNTEIRGFLSKLRVTFIHKELEQKILQNLARLQEQTNAAKYPGAENGLMLPDCQPCCKKISSQGCPCGVAPSGGNTVCRGAREPGCNGLQCSQSAVDATRRLRSTPGAPTPMVHIGTVGSANTVIESAKHRDAIAGKDKIIAFESEGAGVWDSLPCIVFKGVCDYADGQRNKEWEAYAAATAASAAKAFLDYWTSGQHDRVTIEGFSRKRPLPFNGETCPEHQIELAVSRSWKGRSRD